MRYPKLKILIPILVVLISVLIIGTVAWLSRPALVMQLAANQFIADRDLATLLKYLRQAQLVSDQLDDLGLLQAYIAELPNYNAQNLIDLPNIELIINQQTEQVVDFQTEKLTDDKFPLGQSYFSRQGVTGQNKLTELDLKINGQEVQDLKLTITNAAPVNAIQVDGSSNVETAKQAIYSKFSQFKQSIAATNNDIFKATVINEVDVTPITRLSSINEKLTRTAAQDVVFEIKPLDKDYVQVGRLTLKQQDCATDLSLTVAYNIAEQNYKFTNLRDALRLWCNPVETKPVKLTCTDCTLAPVDKTYELASNYVPAVVATNLPGGGSLTQPARDALAQLISAAKAQGINMTVLSSYRSYENQKATFDYWVGTETAKGFGRAEAEKRANVYSARPGHSEHQLGTTVDLRCSTCNSFDNSAGNLAVYKFIEQNAHVYGYVISYPKNTQQLTGYTYEPWHIRYVGTAIASELFDTGYVQGNGYTLAHLLALRGGN